MKKPTLKQFAAAVSKHGGNLSKVAENFNVSRTQLYRWMTADKSFKEVVNDARMKLFDECLSTARAISVGIPDIQNGKMVGWIERPDGNMLRYLISCLGKKEGFGESVDITSGGEKVGLKFELVTSKDALAKIAEDVPDIEDDNNTKDNEEEI